MNGAIAVRPATVGDLTALRALKPGTPELDPAHAARLFAAPDIVRVLVAVDGDSVVGCCTLVHTSVWNATGANVRNTRIASNFSDDDAATIAGALYRAADAIARGEWGCTTVRRS